MKMETEKKSCGKTLSEWVEWFELCGYSEMAATKLAEEEASWY